MAAAVVNAGRLWQLCLERCGCNTAALLLAVSQTQGIDGFDTLVSLTDSDLDSVAVSINKTPRVRGNAQQPVVLNAITLKKMKAMRLWALWQIRMGLQPLPANFDAVNLDWGVQRMDFELRCKQSDSIDPPEPDRLNKIGYDVWNTFWRQFTNYCGAKRGAMKIPLSYVFREHELPTPEVMATNYADSDENLMMKVRLTGPDYLFDNKTVWGILTRLVGHGTAWPFIKHYETTFDGRRAIQILKTQSLGTASNSSRQARAYSSLRKTTYEGKSNRYAFSTYVAALQFAFTELQECGIVISENQKVDYLLTNCHKSPAKECFATINGDLKYQDNFGECCAYISQHLAKHNVYETSWSSSPNNKQRNLASVNSNGNTKLKFTNEEWHGLSPDEKETVKTKRRELKKKEAAKAGSGKTASATPKTLKRENYKLKKKIAALQASKPSEDGNAGTDTSDDEDVPMKPAPKKQKTS